MKTVLKYMSVHCFSSARTPRFSQQDLVLKSHQVILDSHCYNSHFTRLEYNNERDSDDIIHAICIVLRKFRYCLTNYAKINLNLKNIKNINTVLT